jgi:hypothetical protein
MRVIALALALALLVASACSSGARCDLAASNEITFSNATAPDAITARAFGASCDQAVLLLVVRDGQGAPLWTWSGVLAQRFGDVFSAGSEERVASFLAQWVQADAATTQAAPEWNELMAGQTTLDQLTYEDIRARDLPMLCHFSATARQICVFWEPAAGAAGLFYEREIAEEL